MSKANRIHLCEMKDYLIEVDPSDNSLWFNGKKVVTESKVVLRRCEKILAVIATFSVFVQAVLAVVRCFS